MKFEVMIIVALFGFQVIKAFPIPATPDSSQVVTTITNVTTGSSGTSGTTIIFSPSASSSSVTTTNTGTGTSTTFTIRDALQEVALEQAESQLFFQLLPYIIQYAPYNYFTSAAEKVINHGDITLCCVQFCNNRTEL